MMIIESKAVGGITEMSNSLTYLFLIAFHPSAFAGAEEKEKECELRKKY